MQSAHSNASAPERQPVEGTSTWEDFLALEEDDLRELVNGELLEIEVPTELHEHAVALLIVLLGSWARSRKAGRVLASGYKIRINARRGVMSDLQFYRRDNPTQPPQSGLSSGHPDLVVEVISPGSRRFDRVTKLAWYASIGVPEYWIVDPESRSLDRLVLRDGKYLIDQALCDDETFRPDSFDGLEIPLAELWELPASEVKP